MLDLMKRGLRRAVRVAASAGSTPVAASKQYYGLAGLDKKLEPYIDFDNGLFVEAGANDGQTPSNTAYFARHRGWRGLLVEPPSRSLRRGVARRGPRASSKTAHWLQPVLTVRRSR
jgi:hypothetical protein